MAGDVRKRKASSDPLRPDKFDVDIPKSVHEAQPALTVLDVLRIALGLLLLNCSLSYFITGDNILWGYRPWFTRPRALSSYLQGPVNFTPDQLSLYNGTDPSLPLYLALNGTIYDVTAGRRIYGPGGSYHVFAGKDAARGFITGCFAEDAYADLRGVEWTYVPTDVLRFDELEGVKPGAAQKIHREQELRKARGKVRETLEGWAKMFRGEGGKDYFEVGQVVRSVGWEESMPFPTLCARAEKGRPKPQEGAQDPGAAHRGG